MASLPLAGVKSCPRRWLIRVEKGKTGGAADTQNSGRGERGSLPLREERGSAKVLTQQGSFGFCRRRLAHSATYQIVTKG